MKTIPRCGGAPRHKWVDARTKRLDLGESFQRQRCDHCGCFRRRLLFDGAPVDSWDYFPSQWKGVLS